MDVTTLGRGGSDTTAVALAVAIRADHCEIFTDVPGVHTADPRHRPRRAGDPGDRLRRDARARLGRGSRDASARRRDRRGVLDGDPRPIHVRQRTGDNHREAGQDGDTPEGARHRARDRRREGDDCCACPTDPGVAAAIFGPFGDAGIDIDIVLQNVEPRRHHRPELHHRRVASAQGAAACSRRWRRACRRRGITATAGIAKVTVIGSGLRGTPGIYAKIFQRARRRRTSTSR